MGLALAGLTSEHLSEASGFEAGDLWIGAVPAGAELTIRTHSHVTTVFAPLPLVMAVSLGVVDGRRAARAGYDTVFRHQTPTFSMIVRVFA